MPALAFAPRDRKSNRTAAGVKGNVASADAALQGHSARRRVRADGVRRGANRCLGGTGRACHVAWHCLPGARSQRAQDVARLLVDQPTGDGYHWTCWSKMYSGCGWARASQSGTASMTGSSQAGGPRAGAFRGGSAGSPIWLRIRATGAASVMKATMRTMSAVGWIAAVLIQRASVRSGSVAAVTRTQGCLGMVKAHKPRQQRWPNPADPTRITLRKPGGMT